MTRDVTTVSLVHFEQYQKSIFVTAEVLKKFGPKIREVKDMQSTNINHMEVTAEVSKDERSSEVKALQE